jgi:hypothetical protein
MNIRFFKEPDKNRDPDQGEHHAMGQIVASDTRTGAGGTPGHG